MTNLKPYQKELLDKLSDHSVLFFYGGRNIGKTKWIKEKIKEIEEKK